MAKIEDIKNYTLTTSWQAIEVDEDTFFTQYTATTTDGTAFDVRVATSGDVLFPVSIDLGTSPFQADKLRGFTSDSKTLFYAKGTDSSVLSILFWRE